MSAADWYVHMRVRRLRDSANVTIAGAQGTAHPQRRDRGASTLPDKALTKHDMVIRSLHCQDDVWSCVAMNGSDFQVAALWPHTMSRDRGNMAMLHVFVIVAQLHIRTGICSRDSIVRGRH